MGCLSYRGDASMKYMQGTLLKSHRVLILLFISSCADLETPFLGKEEFMDFCSIPTRSFFDFSEFRDEDYVVTLDDIQCYLEFKQSSKINNPNYSSPQVNQYDYEGVPVFYSIDYGQGWELISADKRGPVVLVASETDSFAESVENEGVSSWINSLAGDIICRRKDSDHISNSTEDVLLLESSSIEFWLMVKGDTKFVSDNVIRTRIEDLPVLPIDDGGYWRLISQSTQSIFYDNLDHMLSTRWSQDSPYNYHCPGRTDGEPGKVPAGCVAISGAQMLFFLHENMGTPQYTYSSASSSGNLYNYSISFSGYNSSIWNTMNTGSPSSNSYDDSSILVSHVGILVGMNYGNDGSSAHTSDLVDHVFEPYGISCSYVSYNATRLKNGLINGTPAIISAFGSVILGIPYHGHSFIADGYKRYRNKTTATYEWVWTDGEYHGGDPIIETTITYSSPIIQTIKLNLGAGNAYYNTDYAISGDWNATLSDGTEVNFIHYRHIINDFQAL